MRVMSTTTRRTRGLLAHRMARASCGVALRASRALPTLARVLTQRNDDDDDDERTTNGVRRDLPSPDTSFCGYSVPHPSEPKMHVRLQTTGACECARGALTTPSRAPRAPLSCPLLVAARRPLPRPSTPRVPRGTLAPRLRPLSRIKPPPCSIVKTKSNQSKRAAKQPNCMYILGPPANDVLRAGLQELMQACNHMADALERDVPSAKPPPPTAVVAPAPEEDEDEEEDGMDDDDDL